MELLYLWIENYRNIQHQGFNFSSKWKFDYQNEQLTVEERPNVIDHFFGKDIVNLTALIGSNGSGKTSVLEFLYEKLFGHHTHKFPRHNESFNIFQISKESLSFFIIDKKVSSLLEKGKINNLKLNKSSFNHSLHQINLLKNHSRLLYSPFLKKHNYETYNLSNLTTTALLQRGKEINNISYTGEVNNYHLNEDINFLKFLNSPINVGKFPFSLSEKRISLKYNFLNKKNSQFVQIKDHLDTLNIKKDFAFIQTLLKHFKSTHTTQEYKKFLFLKSTIINLLQCISYCLVRINQFKKIPLKESLLPQNKQNIYQEFKKLIDKNSTSIKLSDLLPMLKNYLIGILTDEFSPIIDFFLQLIENENENNSSIENKITVTKEQALEALEEYQSQYFQLIKKFFEKNYILKHTEIIVNTYGRIFRLIDFDVEGMSSGERLLTQLFARLNSARYYIKSSACKSLTILIDEGETGLHPQWQKQYIKQLTQTLPLIFKDIPIQIILTSHSPFIVSDLPKENIIFLDTDEQNNVKVVDGLKQKETFGANIHTLFSDAFFMDGGLMGDFAKEQINALIQFLNNEDSFITNNEQAQQYINLIGEPIIKRQLQKMLDSKRLTKVDENKKDINSMKEQLAFLEQQVAALKQQINPVNNDSHKS